MLLRRLFPWLLSILLIGGGLLLRYQYAQNFRSALFQSVQRNVTREIRAIDEEAKELLTDSLQMTSKGWDKARHYFLGTDSSGIVAWNRNQFLPELSLLNRSENVFFLTGQRGDFIVKKWPAKGGTLFCLLTLSDRYQITNSFLGPQFNEKIFPSSEILIIEPLTTYGDPVVIDGKTIFRVAVNRQESHESLFCFLLLAAGIVFLLIGIRSIVRSLEGSSYDASFLLLLASFVGVRYGMVLLEFPARFLHSGVFDPTRFASSTLNASMGDLLLNATSVLVVISYLFLNFSRLKLVRWLYADMIRRFVGCTISLFACFFGLLFSYNFVEVIYHNSAQSLDLMQSLSFDGVRTVAIVSVLTACVSSFLFVHAFLSLAQHLEKGRGRFLLALLIAAIMFTIQSRYMAQTQFITVFLGIFYFGTVTLLRIMPPAFRFSFPLFIYLVFILAIFSLQNALAVRGFFQERQTRDQFRYAKDFLTERDVLGEYLLDQARQRIEKDQFIQTRMASLFLSKNVVANKIRRVHLSNYFDRYEIKINTRAAVDSRLLPDSSRDYLGRARTTLKDSVVGSPDGFISTGYTGISYASASDVNTLRRYHAVFPIYYQRPAGYIVLDLALKRVVPENVYPELLVDNRFSQVYRNRDFSFAVFTKGKLISSFGNYNYERDFPLERIANPELYNDGLEDMNFYHIGLEDADGSVAVVSSTVYPIFNLISNFSFWFVLGLVILFAGQGILGVYYFLRGEQVNYSARIQLFIFLAFLLPVMAVSFTTLTLIARSNEDAIQQDFLRRSTIIGQRIANLITPEAETAFTDTSLEDLIKEYTASLRIDISVYSPKGTLMATSQQALFDNQLLAPLMDHGALKRIALDRETQTVSNEQIGRLQYSCAYSAVLSPDSGKLLAIVGLPFFESAAYLQRSQSLILANILLVFVLVFILFSLLSFWAARSLTFPIRFITRTLGQTTLTGENKPLHWESPDEIGMLVKQYNRMLINLEESKKVLAQSEKETAWREMARQVAHEIKNPLTPMKLTLQQMEQAIKSGNLPAEKSQKSVDVLLKQVDILNGIAASFSSFASMPSPSPSKVSLVTVLHDTVALFQAEPHSRVAFIGQADSLYVSLDQTSFGRAIGNIIINALQARKEGQELLTVEVEAVVKGSAVIVTIRDNGRGMSQEVRDRIFQPHFTTKQSGSGLGLMMAREIVLQAGGNVWFESVQGSGTTFFVEVPLAG